MREDKQAGSWSTNLPFELRRPIGRDLLDRMSVAIINMIPAQESSLSSFKLCLTKERKNDGAACGLYEECVGLYFTCSYAFLAFYKSLHNCSWIIQRDVLLSLTDRCREIKARQVTNKRPYAYTLHIRLMHTRSGINVHPLAGACSRIAGTSRCPQQKFTSTDCPTSGWQG